MDKDIDKKIGRATAWSSVTELLARIISPLINMVLARLLAPEAFGVVTTITMVISFAEVFSDAGFQKYIIQHEFENEDELNKSTTVAFWTNLCLSLLICAIIFVFRHKIAVVVGSPGLGNSISIATISMICVAFSSIQTARFRRSFDFKSLFFVRMGTSLIPVVVTIPLALVLKNYWALLIGTISSHMFSAVVLTIKSKWKPTLFYDFRLFKQMFSFSAWTLLESIAVWVTGYVDIFIVGAFLSSHELGLYKTTMTTVNAYMAIITSAIIPVLFSSLSRFQNDDDKFKDTYFSFQRKTALFVVPMGIGMFLYSDFVVSVLLGSQWMEITRFMGYWGFMSAISIIFSYFPSAVYRSKGMPKISLILQMIHLAFLVPTLIISLKYGFVALYTSRSFIRVQMVIVDLFVIHFIFGIKMVPIFKNLISIVVSTIIMAAIALLMKLASFPEGPWTIVSIMICVVVYFSAIFVISKKQRKEIMQFLTGVLKKAKVRLGKGR